MALVGAYDMSSLSGSNWSATALTWAGHEFLDAARNETVWQRAMTTFKDKGGSVSLDVLKAILTATAMQVFGLRG